MSFGVKSGSVFSLLGTNGAGKTTTFKSITANLIPTSGEIYIKDNEVPFELNKITKYIGYCP